MNDDCHPDKVTRCSMKCSEDKATNIENPKDESSFESLEYDNANECEEEKIDGFQYQNQLDDSLSNYVNGRCNAALDDMFQFCDESIYALNEELNCEPVLSNIHNSAPEFDAAMMTPYPETKEPIQFDLQGIFNSVEILRKETAKLYYKIGTLERTRLSAASVTYNIDNGYTQSIAMASEIDYDIENSLELKTCFELNLPIETIDSLDEFDTKLKDKHFRTISVSSMII